MSTKEQFIWVNLYSLDLTYEREKKESIETFFHLQLKKCFDVTSALLMQIHCFCEKKTFIVEVPWEIENNRSCIMIKKARNQVFFTFQMKYIPKQILCCK